MINKWLITGDTHGNFTRFTNLDDEDKNNENLGIIILGDAGFNFYLDERDNHWKNKLAKLYKFTIYCVRGNHEARPSNLENMVLIYDENVDNMVYVERKYPKIRYFLDYGVYRIGDYKTLIIGGAYSVDKNYRLAKGSPWFEDEQLTKEEMDEVMKLGIENAPFDLILSHTCPYSLRPTDMFLSFIDQSLVDNTMEYFMENIKDNIPYKVWCWGHYHESRVERPYHEMYFHEIDDLDIIMDRWKQYDETGRIDWWLNKGPNYYMED